MAISPTRITTVSGEAVTLAAPLTPNINHRETVIGGSTSALAILAAWSLLYVRLQAEGMGKKIVIHSNTVEYNKPILDDFRRCRRVRRVRHSAGCSCSATGLRGFA